MAFKILSYNLLASKYALSGMHSYCAPQYLAWRHRSTRIQRQLLDYRADIVCLQEVERDAFCELSSFFKGQGLEGWHLPRQPGLAGDVEGVALFVRSRAFKVLEVQPLQMSSAVDALRQSGSWDEALEMTAARPEGSLLAHLEHVASGTRLIVAATHFFWDPRFPHVKVLQAALLCQQIAAFAKACGQGESLPVILAGDLNSLWRKSQPDAFDPVIPKTPAGDSYLVSGVYELLSGGSLGPAHPDHPASRCKAAERRTLTSAGLQLQSMHLAALGREPYLTTKTASFHGCLDYVFFSGLGVVSVEPLPEGALDASAPFFPIPSDEHPSDHLPIGGSFVFK